MTKKLATSFLVLVFSYLAGTASVICAAEKVTINSDDPAYFGGNVNQNYFEIQAALNLTEHEIYQLAKNSFKYSFINDTLKKQYLNELEVYYLNNNKF